MSNSLINNMSEDMKLFLVSSYFGDINEENIENRCIECAYLDLSRNIPYLYSVSKLEDMKKNDERTKAEDFEKRKKQFKKSVSEEIQRLILCKNSSREIIDALKKYIDDNYKDIWKEEASFSYGLCQKWVNMTLKYLWLFGKCPIEESKLDVPIDSYIIHAAMEQKSEEQKYALEIQVDELKRDTSWSTMDKELYEKIQEAIVEKVSKSKTLESPIRWENAAWIVQARREA